MENKKENKGRKVKEKDVWYIIIENYEELKRIGVKKIGDYGFVRGVVERIENDNDIKIPIKIVHKLDKRYIKMVKSNSCSQNVGGKK